MLDLATVYCRGYVTTPIVEACRQRGLFKLLDTREFRDRTWLTRELKANEGYFTIALEVLESIGWLEKNNDDAYCLTNNADGYRERGLTPLYAIEPEQLFTQDSQARTLRKKIEQLFLRSEGRESASQDPARGSIVVPLVVYLQRLGTDDIAEAFKELGPHLSRTVIELFVRQQWLAADTAHLTVSGKALLQQSAFQVVASYRPVLEAIPELLFGDHDRAFREIRDGGISPSLCRRALPLIAVDDQPQYLEVTAETLTGLQHQKIDARQPPNHALNVLAADQPAHYLDRQGQSLNATTVLSYWQEYLRDLAQSIGYSQLLILGAHAAPPQLVNQEPQDFEPLHVEWIHRLRHEYLIGAEAFITLAAGVGLFNDDCVKRYPRSSDACQISLHSLTKRDYIIRHATNTDLDRLCQLEKLCWQHTQTSRKQIRSRLQKYPKGQFVLEKDGNVLGVIYSQRIAITDALLTCTAADVHKLHDESGSIIQLLAVNIDPRVQNAGYGDQLLEFMLQRCSLMTGIERVVGVTLCKNYDPAGLESFEEYIHQQGRNQDPVLAFHHAHGAEVVKAIPGYRPQDQANLTNGVLVSYDILNRPGRDQRLKAEGSVAAKANAETQRIHRQQIAEFVRREAAELLGIGESELDIDRPVMEMGLDSADLLKLQRLCEQRFGLALQTGFFFEYSSIKKVIDYLTMRLAAPAEHAIIATPVNHNSAPPRDIYPAPTVRNERADSDPISSRDIAIVGISCKLPGGIETPDQLWQMLSSNECVIGSFPRSRRRWPTSAEYPGIDQGGFVTDADAFDAAFFRMSPAEAEITDPQQRMLLELAWACLEDAGITPLALRGSNTGVFVGASNCDYSRLVQEAGMEIEAHNGVGSSLAILANRISYFFDLSGPSLVVDTACSSSLVALHSAVQSLRSRECATALVGGVNLICHPDLSVAYHKAGMLASDGRCKVFDARANGYVRSEGAVVLLLKPLHAAVADQNRIHAVIRGGATNHGGLSGGLTVPNPQKQKELLMAAWKDAGIAAQDLTYIEAHGTGTSLGDPIEIQGIQAAYAELASEQSGKPCAIGSVKSNLGHLEPAAGITGLLKVILSFQHRQLPASVNFEQLNPKISLKDTPFFIQDRLGEWDAERPRLAAVSSFGSGGANAHVVVQEYSTDLSSSPEDIYLFVLSAASEDRLPVYVTRVMQWLERQATPTNFADAIFTWQVGRTAMKQRLAIKVKDHLDLLNKLKQWLAGNSHVTDLWSGRMVQKDSSISRVLETKSGRQLIDHALSERDLDLLATLWVAGSDIDWRKYYEKMRAFERKPKTVSLPTYPFARDHYWIDITAARQGAVAGRPSSDVATCVIHPLLHSNTSDLSQQSYSAIFTGEEFFLSDHQVRADGRTVQKVLPAVAYLEMARAAIDHALPARPESTVLELRNSVWVQPIVVTRKTQIGIALSANDDEQIHFEIYSEDTEQRHVHCQGRAVLSRQLAPARLDIEQLKAQMLEGHVEPNRVYAACAEMGLIYGPAFQAIAGIHLGCNELLAHLRLPRVVQDTGAEYVLHPSVMDGAVQASVAWIEGPYEASNQPRLPFALESLRIVSPCSPDMFAWVRYSRGNQVANQVVKLDIDLCDERGNICVQMHGFSSRVPSRETDTGAARIETKGTLLATPVWQASGYEVADGPREVEYTQHHVVLCELAKVNPEKLESLVPHSHCLQLHAQEHSIAQRYSEYALSCFERIQSVLQGRPRGKVLVQVVVAGDQDQAVLAGVSGLVKTAALENPNLIGQILLVPPSMTTAELARQLQDEKTRGQETPIKYQEGVRQVLRWQEIGDDPETSPMVFKDEGVYLITGGLGGLGLLFAREILERTREAHVVLTGRSAFRPEKQNLLDESAGHSRRLSYRQVDIGSLDQVGRLIAGIKGEYGQLAGILHCAGMIADNFILKKSAAQFSEVLAPKVTGTFNLDQASRNLELDFFVLFSSIAGAIGNVGQADYATANGFMDQFAAYRNRLVATKQRHGRTRSINWPLWQAGGMRMDAASRDLLYQATGIQPMQTATGLRAFYQSLRLPYDQILVVEGDLTQMRRALLKSAAAPSQSQAEQAVVADDTRWETLAEKTQEYLRKQLSGLLKMPSHKLDPQAALEQYGIDSMLAMKLTNQLEETFGSLSKTLFFEYQTIRDLSEYFTAHHSPRLTELFGATANRTSEPAPTTVPPLPPVSTTPISGRRFLRARNAAPGPTTEFDAIAIIGLSGRYPEAINLEAYWDNLRERKDCIIEVPRERWDWRAYFSEDRNSSGRHYSKWGGFIAGVDEFDPLFFNISPREAKYIDPQERLFLQHAWMAVEDAGYTRASLQVPSEQDLAGQVGVYVGVMYSEYQLFGAEVSVQDLRMGFAGNLASIANRVSYALNLHGPSMTLDTMCSSSLTAIHVACQDLKLGRTSLAVAGGVNVSIHPNKYLMLSIGQFISSDGHCQSFGEGGDGYIPGEGVGVVVLKRLSEAKRDGDHIYGIIRGSALTHGGKTNGYTVPNPQAQASAINRALAESQTDARHISYIEAHGTGTKLGDPIEIAALSKAFQQYTQDTEFCLIGSAKSNIGHCESAAGIAGLTKVLLQMQHQQIVPSLHSAQLNPHIDFQNSPFVVNQSLRNWEQPVIDGRRLPRIAGISSFGAGGSNAHMIVEEYQPPVQQPIALAKAVILLSARTAEQLQQKARDLLDFVRPRLDTIDLVAMAYTLQVGREAMEERLGFVVGSIEELAEKLQAYVGGKQNIEDVYQGQVKRNKEALSLFSADADLQQTVDKWIASRKFSKLLDSWVKGLEVEWSKLYGEGRPQRVSLPTYPFARERYWVDTAVSKPAAVRGADPTTAVLHPLLHHNTSDLSEQRFRSTFTGEEFFLADHQLAVNGHASQKVLPGVAYLEMARAAIEHALPAPPESPVLELRNTVWAQPVVVSDKMQVSIALSANDHEQIDYEIYSQGTEHEIIHCQGQAVLSRQAAPARLDLEQLAGQMGEGDIEPDSVYAACTRIGLVYGPAFRGITAIHRGNRQLLARLRLPKTVADTSGAYVLHPSLMDGALQACTGLIGESSEHHANQPRLPFALESLRIVSPCTPEMVAWVRYAPGSQAGDNVVKLDIDLCDDCGNLCIQMHGFSSRVLTNEITTAVAQDHAIGSLLATGVWQSSSAETSPDAGQLVFAEHHLILCELSNVNVSVLESVVPRRRSLSLQAEQHKTIAQRYSEYALACFERIQAILQEKPQGKVLFHVVVADHQEQAVLAGLSGLLKTAALENPRFIGQIILVPVHMTAEELARYLREEKTLGLDPLVRYGQGARQVLRWQEVAADPDKPPIAFKDDGVYLITGGLGGLGVLFAKEILEQTRQARVVLTGRSPLSAEKQALLSSQLRRSASRLDGLSAPTSRLSYRQVDLGDVVQVKRLIAGIHDEYHQLNGILHCAGMISDHFILKKTAAEFSQVLAPKVTGTFNLDQASRDVELDFFVLFSSMASALGNLGQADYAAANGFMDEFAAYRNQQVASKQRHGRTRSINWPLWQAGGMGIDRASLELLQQATGMQPMQTTTGMQAFHRSLAVPYDQILVVEGDLTQMRRALAARRPVLPQRLPLQIAGTGSVTAETDTAEIDSGNLAEKIQEYLRRQFSDLLKLPPHRIDPQAGLEEYGIDSVLSMQLINRLEQTFGSLSKTLIFEYQTIEELSEYFIANHSPQLTALFAATPNRRTEASSSVSSSLASIPAQPISSRRFSRARVAAPTPATESDPIAVVGLSGRYPEAINLDAYWHNLREGKDCIIEVPRERWDWQAYFTEDRTKSGRHYSKWGGFIAGVDEFDPLFFNIAPKEAKYIDPQERLFLQHAWMAVEDAGYTRASLQVPSEQDLAGQAGVYVGVMWSEYHLFGAAADVQDLRMGFAGNLASIANRVSYALNLHGPSVTLDTMCSSSLTAIHFACQDLKLGRTNLAIAGGVNVSVHPHKYLMLSVGQFISSDGHCQSFGEGGDGYIPGEGVGVVVLKRLSEAKRDGDHIYGIIRGSALTHGGKTNGYTVPNPQAQASAINRALAESQTDARHISYIEAHGTGTKLGDPIEIAALSKAFQQYTQDTEFCLIGSAKSNIGHCESAAGIAGLTKVLLQMQHQQIVPSLHSAQLNPHIDFQNSPFVVNQSLRNWEQPVIDGRRLPRIAGISSFGAGGSNAHMIVEEYQPPVQQPIALAKAVILLSARTAEQLQQKARDLLDFVRPRLDTIDLVAMAYTLQVGREAMEERLGFVVGSVEELAEKLQAYVGGEQNIEDVYQGQVKRNKEALSLFSTDVDLKEAIDKWIAGGKLSRLLDLWVKGLEVEWSKLYGEGRPQRVSLPTYPFARERYWVDTAVSKPAAVRGADPTTAVLHPLLHHNTSDLSEQRFRSTFTGEEFFLADHQLAVNGHANQKVLPGVAYLEMARAAIEHALPAPPESPVLELRNTVWAQPVVVSDKMQVSIALSANDHEQIDYEIYSQGTEHEIIHCQGQAVLSRQAAPARLDLEQLAGQMGEGDIEPDSVYAACTRIGLVYGPAFRGITAIHRGNRQLLARLRLPKTVADTSGAYVLHPSLMDGALQACTGLIGESSEHANQPRLPFALESLRIVSPCTPEMVAWVRYAPGSQSGDDVVKLDIDLCDERGNVCAQMRGASWQPASRNVVEPMIAQPAVPALSAALPDITNASPVRREIVFLQPKQPRLAPVERKRPAAISLAAPSVLMSGAASSSGNTVRQPSAARASITLSSATTGTSLPGGAAPSMSSVRLYDDGQGIFSIDIGASSSSITPPGEIIGHVLQAMDKARQEASVKVLMIRGAERCFLRGGREDYNEAVDQKLYEAFVSFPYPVVAVQQGDATGACFMAAALCDFMVCNEDGQYGYTEAERHFYPTTADAILFSERFGDLRAQDFLYVSTPSTGRQLRAKGWTCPIVPAAQVEAYAQQLASMLATKSQDALRLLKQHLTRHLVRMVKELTRVEALPPSTEGASDTVATTIVFPAEHIHLDTSVDHVLIIKFSVANKVELRDLVADLGHIVARIHRSPYYKAIVLVSEHPEFLPCTNHAIPEDAVLDLQRLLVDSEIPIVAGLTGSVKDNAWLIAQFCDACVYSRQGVYSSGNIALSPVLAQMAAAVFTHRFGSEAASEILLTGADYSGGDLRQRFAAVIVAEHDYVLSSAVQVAESWARLPRTILVSWKKHTATTIREKIRSLPAAEGWEQKDGTLQQAVAATTPIALRSEVVTATAHPGGIVVVKMEEREAKNMFSDALVAGVSEVFAHLEQNPAYKVVVLTGYDSYFASGGTKEGLLAIQEGKARFTDFKIYQSALDCRLPVIAAMQGHGIGAGWSMGMFGDIVLLSEESRYVSPYMNYGFTPGAGATYILPEKIGQDLARESLLTAQQYTGRELKERGLRLRVVPRAEVYPAAMALAKQIAQASRDRLISLKQQLTGYVRQPLEETYSLELAMHEKTFVGQADTLAQIHSKFYQEIEPQGSQQTTVEPANPSVSEHERVATSNLSVESDLLRAVSASLKTLLATELQMRESDVDENARFVDLGLDSISGVTWIRKINEKYQTSIEATKVYSYPTLTQLSRYVREEAEKHGTVPSSGALPAPEMPAAPVNRTLPRHSSATEHAAKKLTSRRSRKASRLIAGGPATRPPQPIAVIGMAGQFPQARNLDEFWRNIAAGRNCITEVPPQRWDVNTYYQRGQAVAGKTTSQWAGTLDEYDQFDPLFFNISPTEAEHMDPQQRLFLQACWHSIENAGYAARSLSGSKCGVFVGCSNGDYHQLSRQHQLSAQGFTGGATSILAARISYFLNLQGPCISIDTACSSSLVAVAQACDSLTSGSSDLALAGGVYVMVGPEMHIKTSQAGMLSPEGRCFTFDYRANGFVPGEGVGVVMLKRLADAERDRDIIHSVIYGWGVNQDGKTNGITAPNPESQTRLEHEVYDRFHIDPADIQLIEAHGTGTKLGDPIEVEGLKKAFKKYTQNKEYCALGSVKSNIGHCLAAAGIAGVLKLIMALKHRELPPTINFERLNEHIDLKDSQFYINSRLRKWEPGTARGRQAATSSFGFSGTNAHIVIGEYLAPAEVKGTVRVVTQNAKTIVQLSARTAEQLADKARDLLDFIRKEGQSIDLSEMAYTLQVGREAMDERLGVLVSSVEQLAEKLEAFVNGDARIEDLYRGQVKRSAESTSIISQDDDVKETIVAKWIAGKKLSKLLELWVNGLELDWNRLYGEPKPKRIPLPPYPFARERYWIDTAARGHVAAERAEAPLHPVLDNNTSDLSGRRYNSTFTGEEFFLTDHRIRTNGRTLEKLLPGVAYLEMARAAIKQAFPIQPASSILVLHNTVWLRPVVVSAPKQVSIGLIAGENDGVDFEIYSTEAGQETLHCQGHAVFSRQTPPARFDIEQIRRQMRQGRLEAADVYAIFAEMGLNYGPAHQAITAIHLGEKQLLAELRLPAVVAANHHEYVLHPSLMDSALQASLSLIVDLNEAPTKPSVPFAVESIRILSACTKEMAAWVRYSKGSMAEARAVKVDIDLSDSQGNLCVQIRGFASRVLESDVRATRQSTAKQLIQVNSSPVLEEKSPFDADFYQSLITDIINRKVSVDEAAKLG